MEKPPYPTGVNGLPILPDDLSCYEDCTRPERIEDTHHLAFERRHYRGGLERAYRNAPEMLAEMCMCKHVDLHMTYSEPLKPLPKAMQGVIAGVIKPMTEAQSGVPVEIQRRV